MIAGPTFNRVSFQGNMRARCKSDEACLRGRAIRNCEKKKMLCHLPNFSNISGGNISEKQNSAQDIRKTAMTARPITLKISQG
jgi:hypothetical protein